MEEPEDAVEGVGQDGLGRPVALRAGPTLASSMYQSQNSCQMKW